MKKKNLFSKIAIALLTFGCFGVTSNLINSTLAVQRSYHSVKWDLNEDQLTHLKQEAYRQMYEEFPSNEILDSIYAIENNETYDLDFYMLNYPNDGNSQCFYVHFNTLLYEKSDIKNNKLAWRIHI